MRHIRGPSGEPLTFGEEVAVKVSQRTLILILGVALAAGGAYADLKFDARRNHEEVLELQAQRLVDHDVLIKVATGIEQLQRADVRREYRENRPTSMGTSSR